MPSRMPYWNWARCRRGERSVLLYPASSSCASPRLLHQLNLLLQPFARQVVLQGYLASSQAQFVVASFACTVHCYAATLCKALGVMIEEGVMATHWVDLTIQLCCIAYYLCLYVACTKRYYL